MQIRRRPPSSGPPSSRPPSSGPASSDPGSPGPGPVSSSPTPDDSIAVEGPVGLTRRQREVLRCLSRLLASSTDPVTLDRLCATLGLASRGSLHKHVRALASAGLVEPPRGLRRGLALTRSGLSAIAGEAPRSLATPRGVGMDAPSDGPDGALPLLGRVAAGRPIEAIETPERFDPGAAWRGQPALYALEVHGDSMTDAGIRDGDVVIVEAREHARDGEIVVALVDGESATLKVIEQRPGRVRLLPAHQGFEPLELDPGRVTIRGVVRGLVRRY